MNLPARGLLAVCSRVWCAGARVRDVRIALMAPDAITNTDISLLTAK